MKLNKEKFLKSELGGNLQECVTAWDHWLTELRKFNIDTVGQKYRETRKAADLIKNQYGSDVYELVQLYSKLNEAGKNKIMEELRDTAALPKYTEPVKRDAQKMA